MPAALQVDWGPIRDAAIAGVPLARLAEQYELDEATIRQRAHRHKWPIPARIRTLAAQHGVATAPSGSKQQVSQGVTHIAAKGESVTSDLAGTLLRNGETGSLKASQLLLSLLQKATPNKLQPLQDVGDVVTSLKGIRLAAGMDRAQNAVQVNLSGFFRPAESDGKIMEDGS